MFVVGFRGDVYIHFSLTNVSYEVSKFNEGTDVKKDCTLSLMFIWKR